MPIIQMEPTVCIEVSGRQAFLVLFIDSRGKDSQPEWPYFEVPLLHNTILEAILTQLLSNVY